jgi:hypothetical protein
MENEVKELIAKAAKTDDANDAMKWSQAATNAANALATLLHIRTHPNS